MPLIDVRCAACGRQFDYNRPIADWPSTKPCPDCGQPTEQVHTLRQASNVDPVVVYRAPDGTFRFPGDGDGLQARHYQSEGFERVELRGAADVRRFERVMNKYEYSRAQRRVEAKHAAREAREKATRGELRSIMQRMTPFGRELAKEAMRRNDNKPRERAQDANFHSEIYSMDRSNREPGRDAQGRRRRD